MEHNFCGREQNNANKLQANEIKGVTECLFSEEIKG
jgi:hypothetical protein